MTHQATAQARLDDQLLQHWASTGRPVAPIDQIDYTLCEDGCTVMVDLYLVDGFHAKACLTPEQPGWPLPAQWTRER